MHQKQLSTTAVLLIFPFFVVVLCPAFRFNAEYTYEKRVASLLSLHCIQTVSVFTSIPDKNRCDNNNNNNNVIMVIGLSVAASASIAVTFAVPVATVAVMTVRQCGFGISDVEQRPPQWPTAKDAKIRFTYFQHFTIISRRSF